MKERPDSKFHDLKMSVLVRPTLRLDLAHLGKIGSLSAAIAASGRLLLRLGEGYKITFPRLSHGCLRL